MRKQMMHRRLGDVVSDPRGPNAGRSGYQLSQLQSVPEPTGIPSSGVALCAALGVLLTAVAYTAGRHGYANSSLADRIYWAGQLLFLVPVSFRLLSRRRSSEATTVSAILTLAAAEYLCKICYSPLWFSYSDELAHWRTAENILLTGKSSPSTMR